MSIFDFSSQCSNCRNDVENSCNAYGSANSFDIDTSAVVADSGALAFACIVLAGIFVTTRRRKRRNTEQEKMIQMRGQSGAV